MKQRRLVLSYYKRRLYKGRTALARAVDFFALRLVMLAAAYLWFSTAVESVLMAIVLSLTATLTASVAAELIKSIRLERFIARERKALASKLFRERLVQLTQGEFYELVRGYVIEHKADFDPECLVCTVQSAAPVSEDDVLRACRMAKSRGTSLVSIFTCSSVSREASALAARIEGMEVGFVTADELTAHGEANRLLPGDEAVDAAVLAEAERERERRKKSVSKPFERWRMRRYIFVAIGLFALSFFVEQALYFRLLSAACLSFGAIAWWLNNAAPREPLEN
ncbi:MAG TPA: hypothetical protein VN540_03080 [Clostridia bacterium]|nr:hypothetical protein [Clostridia bacterium]